VAENGLKGGLIMSQIPFESLPFVSEELGNFQGWVGRWAGIKVGDTLEETGEMATFPGKNILISGTWGGAILTPKGRNILDETAQTLKDAFGNAISFSADGQCRLLINLTYSGWELTGGDETTTLTITINLDRGAGASSAQLGADAALSFAFDETETELTAALGVSGIMMNLQITVPDFTNEVTVTPSLKTAADGKTVWLGPALAKGASYNPDSDPTLSVYWANQVIKSTYLLVMTLSGAAGGEGGTVTALARVLGA